MSSSVFVLLLVLCSVSLCAGACVLSSDKLSGSNFEISRDDANACDAPAIRQPGGAWLNAAQIVVVANTTVTFNITSTTPTFLFGLTLSNVSSNNVGSAVGLTISADSLAAGSCRAYPETDVNLNTFTRNYSDAFVLVPQTCVLTWKVPVPTNNTQYYYFIGNSNPVLINIMNSTDGPTGSSGSTTIPPTPTATPTGNTTATPTPTATPTGNTTATPTPTAKPTGNNTATPTPGGATTQPPTPTATPTPKTNATLAPTVTPNTGAATAGHVNAALRGVVGAFICAMLSAL